LLFGDPPLGGFWLFPNSQMTNTFSSATALNKIAARIRPDESQVPHWLTDDYFDKQARLLQAMKMSYELTNAEKRLARQMRPTRPSLISRLWKLIEWSAKPSQQGKPRSIPGVGLEMTVFGLFVVIGLANLLV
jgi:hypothetical protein